MALNVKSHISLFNSLPFPGQKNRKPIQTKYRMPLLNWQALKPNQVTGTVFNEMDDEGILGVRDAVEGCCSIFSLLPHVS